VGELGDFTAHRGSWVNRISISLTRRKSPHHEFVPDLDWKRSVKFGKKYEWGLK
jgi:hypothetical protein